MPNKIKLNIDRETNVKPIMSKASWRRLVMRNVLPDYELP